MEKVVGEILRPFTIFQSLQMEDFVARTYLISRNYNNFKRTFTKQSERNTVCNVANKEAKQNIYRKHAIEEKSLTFENIYRILEHFSKIYDIINDEERKELLAELIKEIHIYPEGESDYPLKSIKFAFPILLDGKEVDEIFLNKPSSVETLICLTRKE